MKKSVLLFLVVAMVLSVGGCAKKAATPKIGVCIYKFDDTFMSYVRNQIETAAKGKIELSVQDSQYDQPKQNDQVDQFLTQGVTALAINLVDPSAVSVIIEKAKAKNVPLVLFNREPAAEDMAAWDKVYYVGAKAQQSGTYQGEIIVDYWKSHPEADLNKDGIIQYVMLMGDPSNTDAKYRTEFSIKAIEDAGIKTEKLAQDTAMWDRVKGRKRWLPSLPPTRARLKWSLRTTMTWRSAPSRPSRLPATSATASTCPWSASMQLLQHLTRSPREPFWEPCSMTL